ncbi:hypothetical protein ACRWC8_24390, partial [Escherichia coli]
MKKANTFSQSYNSLKKNSKNKEKNVINILTHRSAEVLCCKTAKWSGPSPMSLCRILRVGMGS